MPLNDFTKPLKLETSFDDIDFYPTETDPREDGILSAGLGIESSAITIFKNSQSHLTFSDQISGSHTLSALTLTASISEIGAASDLYFNPNNNSLISSNVQNAIEENNDIINSHIINNNIHFTENSINHSNIQNIGSNTHNQIDNHISNSNIHFTENSINHSNIQGMSYLTSGHIGFERDAFEYSSNPTANNDDSDTAGIGRKFQISEQWININNNLTFVCTNNTTNDASWLCITELQDRQSIKNEIADTTTNNTFENIPDMSLITANTYDNNDYFIFFNSNMEISKNIALAKIQLTINDTAITDSYREVESPVNNYNNTIFTQTYLSNISPNSNIKVQWSISKNTLTFNEKSLIIDGIPKKRNVTNA